MTSHENLDLEDPVSARQARDLPVFPFVYSSEDLRAYWSTVNVAVGLLLATAGTFLAVLITATDPQTRSGRHYVAWSLLCFITTLLINLSQQISFATASSGLDQSRERTYEDTDLENCYLQDNLNRWFLRFFFPSVYEKHLKIIEERNRAVEEREEASQERRKAGEEREKVIMERRAAEERRAEACSRLQQQQDGAQDEEVLSTLAGIRLQVGEEIEMQRKEAITQEEEEKLQSVEIMVQNAATELQSMLSNSRIEEVGRQLEKESRQHEAASRRRERASMERERESAEREKHIGEGRRSFSEAEAAQSARDDADRQRDDADRQREEADAQRKSRSQHRRRELDAWFHRDFPVQQPSFSFTLRGPIYFAFSILRYCCGPLDFYFGIYCWLLECLNDFSASPFGLFLRFLHYQKLACIQTFAFLSLIAGLALLGATLIKIGLVLEGSLIVVITCGGPLLGLGPPTFLHFIRVPPEYYLLR